MDDGLTRASDRLRDRRRSTDRSSRDRRDADENRTRVFWCRGGVGGGLRRTGHANSIGENVGVGDDLGRVRARLDRLVEHDGDVGVRAQAREIGVLRALGWKPRRVVLLILGESLVLGLSGSVAGTLLGIAGVRHWRACRRHRVLSAQAYPLPPWRAVRSWGSA